MNVLSLFDGISCGQIALNRVGVQYDNYFASEIDTHAIQVTQNNYPHTIQLGSVTEIKGANLPKIDLLIGGSPCQGFSFAGKGLDFEDPRSKLFFEYLRLLKELKPRYFLLENVLMQKDCEDVITEKLGVLPVLINSASVSAQDRKRLYWTNIPHKQLPLDSGIYLKTILNPLVDERYYIKDKTASRYKAKLYKKDITKSCVTGTFSKYQGDRIFDTDCKASSLSASGGNNGGGSCNIIKDGERLRKLTPEECEMCQTIPLGYTSSAPRTQRYKMIGNGWTVDVIAHIFKGLLNGNL